MTPGLGFARLQYIFLNQIKTVQDRVIVTVVKTSVTSVNGAITHL